MKDEQKSIVRRNPGFTLYTECKDTKLFGIRDKK